MKKSYKFILLLVLILRVAVFSPKKKKPFSCSQINHPVAVQNDMQYCEVENEEFAEVLENLVAVSVPNRSISYQGHFQFVIAIENEYKNSNDIKKVVTNNLWTDLYVNDSGYILLDNKIFKTDKKICERLLKIYDDSVEISIVKDLPASTDFLLINPFTSNEVYIRDTSRFNELIKDITLFEKRNDVIEGNDKMFYASCFIGVSESFVSINGQWYGCDKSFCKMLLDYYNEINNKINSPTMIFEEKKISKVLTNNSYGKAVLLEGNDFSIMSNMFCNVRIYDRINDSEKWQWGLFYIATFIDDAGKEYVIYCGQNVVEINGMMYTAAVDDCKNLINRILYIRKNMV